MKYSEKYGFWYIDKKDYKRQFNQIEENKVKHRSEQKSYYRDNRTSCLERNKKWNREHPVERRQHEKKYEEKKKATNRLFKKN